MTERAHNTAANGAVAVVDSIGPGIEVARAIRRALAAAGWKAAGIDAIVIGGDQDVAGSPAAHAAVRRGLGRFADGIAVISVQQIGPTPFRGTTARVLEVSFRRDGGATVSACLLGEAVE